jgi:FlaA1/EpsC-like NDP-sugar epimerase
MQRERLGIRSGRPAPTAIVLAVIVAIWGALIAWLAVRNGAVLLVQATASAAVIGLLVLAQREPGRQPALPGIPPVRSIPARVGGIVTRSTRRSRHEPPSSGMKRALIVGAGAGGQLIADELRSHPKWRLWPVGFLDDDPAKQGRRIDHIPVLGGVSAMPVVADRESIDAIIIAMPSAGKVALAKAAAFAHGTGAEVLTMPELGSILRGEERTTALKHVRPVDVLGRPIVEPDHERCRSFIRGKRVLITGAAGSIGQELARQVIGMHPSQLIILDINESDLFDRHQELAMQEPTGRVTPVVMSIVDRRRIDRLFADLRPQIVFHAAAYKHVPMMEHQPDEAVRTNIDGTRVIAEASARHRVQRFVLVSTDKAVRPSSVMGATKRVAEMVVSDVAGRMGLSACAVRFGNVLGSRGSVIPIFERQIAAGGPVTVTHPDMRRYFMTIPEASGLIIQSGAFGEDGVIYILDMGDDVSILELAERVIELSGFRPYTDIPIVFTGMRDGEKLREDLSNDFECARPSPHPKIRMLRGGPDRREHRELTDRLHDLALLAESGAPAEIRDALHDLVRWGDEHEEFHGTDHRAAAGAAVAASAD